MNGGIGASHVRELRIVYSGPSPVGPRPQVDRPADAATLLQARLDAMPDHTIRVSTED